MHTNQAITHKSQGVPEREDASESSLHMVDLSSTDYWNGSRLTRRMLWSCRCFVDSIDSKDLNQRQLGNFVLSLVFIDLGMMQFIAIEDDSPSATFFGFKVSYIFLFRDFVRNFWVYTIFIEFCRFYESWIFVSWKYLFIYLSRFAYYKMNDPKNNS